MWQVEQTALGSPENVATLFNLDGTAIVLEKSYGWTPRPVPSVKMQVKF